jgi:hypothetical protein
MQTLETAIILILYAALISLPGLAITLTAWRLSRGMQHGWARMLFRSGLIAVLVTPSIYGHAGPVPAIILVFLLHGRERLAGVVLILVVWVIVLLVMGIHAKGPGFRARYVDELCAWLLFLAGILHIFLTDLFSLHGTLDTALVWLFAAMLNLVRVKNDNSVRRLRIFCTAANLSALALEAVRWRMFHDPLSLAALALITIESAFSIRGGLISDHRIR